MALAGLYDYQAVVLGTKVKVNLFHLRYQRLHKINGDKAAHSTCHLVQQAGRLVPVVVFRELADMGISHGAHTAFIKKCVEHGAQQHLKGG